MTNQPIEVLVSGASFVRGHGLDHDKDDPKLWVNQLVNNAFDSVSINNVAEVGRDNEWIFLEAMSNLIKKNYDLLIVGWAPIPRFNFHVGLELYDTRTKLDATKTEININNNMTITGKELSKIGDALLRLHNDHWDFLKLVKYVNSLVELQVNIRKKKIIFFNPHNDLPQDFFVKKNIKYPSELSKYEEDLLNVATRDDEEIFALYDMIHNDYQRYGGIHAELWANLYNPFINIMVDGAPHAKSHPGYQSQEIFVKEFLPAFRNIVLN